MKALIDHPVDFTIVGGGLVGCLAASMLARLEYRVAIIESRDISTIPKKAIDKPFALNTTTYQWLHDLGVITPELDKELHKLYEVWVSEAGHLGHARLSGNECNLDELGVVIPESALSQAVANAIQNNQHITLYTPAAFESFQQTSDGIKINFTQNNIHQQINTQYLIAADGAHSRIRDALDIHPKNIEYGQSALVSRITVSSPKPHRAFQRFTAEGTLALLPTQKRGEYGLVISAEENKIDVWKSYSDDDFLKKLQSCFGFWLGRCERIGERVVYPLRGLDVDQVVYDRVILMGHAAHVLHPVSAQGLNLSIADIRLLEHHLSTQSSCTEALTLYSEEVSQQKKIKFGWSNFLVDLFSNEASHTKMIRRIGLPVFGLCSFVRSQLVNRLI